MRRPSATAATAAATLQPRLRQQLLRCMQDAAARSGTWLDASKCRPPSALLLLLLLLLLQHRAQPLLHLQLYAWEGLGTRTINASAVGAGRACGACRMRRLAREPDWMHRSAVTSRCAAAATPAELHNLTYCPVNASLGFSINKCYGQLHSTSLLSMAVAPRWPSLRSMLCVT